MAERKDKIMSNYQGVFQRIEKKYILDEEKYNAVSKFIHLIGLMSENFSAMKTKKCKINDVPFDEFVRSINDINRKSNFNLEDNRNGIRFNPFRAR